jgi:predicted nucleotidyltransferase
MSFQAHKSFLVGSAHPTVKKFCSVRGFKVRVRDDQAQFLKQSISKYLPDGDVYLIGSRANDKLKGGDIDILVIAEKELTGQDKRDIKLSFYKEFGEQKVDIVSIKRDEPSTFKELALLESVKL